MQHIENDKYYSLSEVVRLQVVPGIKSYPTLHNEVLRDNAKPASKRTLDALIIGEGRGRTIRIKGSNLKKYIATRN